MRDHQVEVSVVLLGRDRGAHVRSASSYVQPARSRFASVDVDIRRDLLRVPYTHAILECADPISRTQS
jgi:hypothetical protein